MSNSLTLIGNGHFYVFIVANKYCLIFIFFRILQKEFDDAKREDIVVNAVYPATHHSKIDQKNISLVGDEDGAR